ncbi:DUF3180 domain-containing protein [Trueperella pecoris]|uniref:DUF3180 domain-containing protein n=1 Tax=Trueperella pecoris TaxID=2733571 RepID=A0A7M1R325_9ACTO|nr:DUF3180 family protein [Trueperella pecoris]QOR48104.1 DUF3180 domain-containing protein [Trueperella pecoris]
MSDGKLRPTSVTSLLAVAVVAGVTIFSLASILVRSGVSPVQVPFWLFLVPVAIGVIVIIQAWFVRQYRRGRRPIDQLYAARIWVLTGATSRGGSILTGGAFGVALAYFVGGPTSFLTEQGTNALIAGLASVVMTVLALVGERWCIDDDATPDAPEMGAAGA